MAPNYIDEYDRMLDPDSDYEQHVVPSMRATPTEKDSSSGEFDVWFLEFSNYYSLNLRRPGSSLSISQTKASPYYRDSWFYDSLKDQYLQGNAEEILHHFHKVAQKIHSKWVKKPVGEQDVTPSYTDLPRASSEPERSAMLDHLASVLESFITREHSDRTVTEARGASLKQEDCNAEDPSSPSDIRRPKRSSDDEWPNSPPHSKRSRSTIASSRAPSVLSRLDTGEVRSSTPLPAIPAPLPVRDVRAKQHRVPEASRQVPSVNTSRSSFVSRVFSEPEVDQSFRFPDTQDTVVTVEASSQHKRGQPPPSEVNPIVSSLSARRTPPASFHERSHLQNNVTQMLRKNEHPSSSYSEFSFDPADIDMAQYDEPVPSVKDLSYTKPMITTAIDDNNLEQRLQDVWREWKYVYC